MLRHRIAVLRLEWGSGQDLVDHPHRAAVREAADRDRVVDLEDVAGTCGWAIRPQPHTTEELDAHHYGRASFITLNACGYSTATSTIWIEASLTCDGANVYGSTTISSEPHSPRTTFDQSPK